MGNISLDFVGPGARLALAAAKRAELASGDVDAAVEAVQEIADAVPASAVAAVRPWVDGTGAPDPADPSSKSAKTLVAQATASVASINGALAVESLPGTNGIVIDDGNGNKLIGIDTALIDHPDTNAMRGQIAGATATADRVKLDVLGPNSFVIDDANGNKLIDISPTKIDHPDTNAMRTALTVPQRVDLLAQMQLVPLYSQSLGTGQAAVPPLSTTALAGAYRFIGGARPQDGGSDPATIFGSLTGYNEQTGLSDGNAAGETPLYGALQMFMQLLASENSITFSSGGQSFLGVVPGEGGKTLAQLSPGTTYFDRLVNSMIYGRSNSDSLSKSFQVAVLLWMQGEYDYSSDTPIATYQDGLRFLRASAETQARTSSGLARMLPLITYQTDTHLVLGKTTPTIALAQLGLRNDPEMAVLPSLMHLPHASAGNLHLSNVGSKWAGAYFGRAMKRWLYDGIKPKAMVPVEVVKSGRNAFLRMPLDAGRSLVRDTATIPDPGNYGFDLVDSSASALGVASIDLTRRDVIQIRATADIPDGFKVRYGWRRLSGSGTGPGQGNIRDDDPLIFDPSGINKPMQSWANIFEMGATS